MAGEKKMDDVDAIPRKSGLFGLFLGFVLALVAGAGAFYAVQSGAISGFINDKLVNKRSEDAPLELAFVPVGPMVIPMGKQSRYQLRFNAQLEVDPVASEQVAHVMPRILDVLNGYLRAVDVEELADPASLLKLRAQMLRRVQLVAGREQVKDLLITEFVFG